MIEGVLKLVDVIFVGRFESEKCSFASRKNATQHRHVEALYIVKEQCRTLHIASLADVGGNLIFHVHRLLCTDQLPRTFEKRDELAQIIEWHSSSRSPTSWPVLMP